MKKCAWCLGSALAEKYHDEEWGVPLHDDRRHFEYLLMEAMQCGLNWNMMLKKRDIFRRCFDDFDFNVIARYGADKIDDILETDGMIKSRKKVEAIVNNARCFLNVVEEYGSFDSFLWSYTENHTYVYLKHHRGQWEAKNDLSDRISRDMRKMGFKYLGSITVYSHLQACGMINDHEPDCFLYRKLADGENVLFI